MSESPISLQIVVIGAGICGLAAATSLQKKGHHVHVLEGGSRLAEIGAGIQVPANAMRVLAAWGLETQFLEKGTFSNVSRFHRYDDGTVKGQFVNDGAPYGYRHTVIHRADYQSILYDAAIEAGVQVSFGKRVITVDEVPPSLTLEDGSVVNCDLILGADGIGSKVRRSLFQNTTIDPKVITTGHCTYRVVLERSKMLQNPVAASFIQNPRTDVWMGPKRHVVAYAIRGTPPQLYNMVLCAPGKASVGVWNEPVSLDVVRETFSGFEPTVQSLLDCADSSHQWSIAEAPRLPRWSSENGRVVLIGDAAHGMMPFAAQGAAQGIEDAAVLGECLSSLTSPSQLPLLIKIYEELRKPRAERMHAVSRANAGFWELEDGEAQQARDERLKLTLEKKMMKEHGIGDENESIEPDGNALYNTPAFSKWLFGYDAIGDARRRVQQEYKNCRL